MLHKLSKSVVFLSALSAVTCCVAVSLAAFPACASSCGSTTTLSGCYACCDADTTCNANDILNCQDECVTKFPLITPPGGGDN